MSVSTPYWSHSTTYRDQSRDEYNGASHQYRQVLGPLCNNSTKTKSQLLKSVDLRGKQLLTKFFCHPATSGTHASYNAYCQR